MKVVIALIAGCLLFEVGCSAADFPRPKPGPVPTIRSVAQLKQMRFPFALRQVTGGSDSIASGSAQRSASVGSQSGTASSGAGLSSEAVSASQGSGVSSNAGGSQLYAGTQGGSPGTGSKSGLSEAAGVQSAGSNVHGAVPAGSSGSSQPDPSGQPVTAGTYENSSSGSSQSGGTAPQYGAPTVGSSSSSSYVPCTAYATGNGVVLRPTQMDDPNSNSSAFTANAYLDTNLIYSIRTGDQNARADLFIEAPNPSRPFLLGTFRRLPQGTRTYVFTVTLTGQGQEDNIKIELGSSSFTKGSMLVTPGGDVQVMFLYDASGTAGELPFRVWKIGPQTPVSWGFYRVQLAQLN